MAWFIVDMGTTDDGNGHLFLTGAGDWTRRALEAVSFDDKAEAMTYRKAQKVAYTRVVEL